MNNTLKIWFVTDIHGSDICFRKFLNSLKTAVYPDVIIIGADISGKQMIPIVKSDNYFWEYYLEGRKNTIISNDNLANHQIALANKGLYFFECDKKTYNRLKEDVEFYEDIFKKLRIERLQDWVNLADQRLINTDKKVIINCGNDDPWYLDEVLNNSKTIIVPEGKLIHLNEDITMISTGLSNMTPWHCPRDVTEKELEKLINRMAANVPDFSKCIFNLHCPPIYTSLDKAPKLDENLNIIVSGTGIVDKSVGSIAVRNAIEKYKPVVSLHGHIHEQHCFEKIGNTICFNPGSEYSEGLLNGVYLEFENNELKHYSLTREN